MNLVELYHQNIQSKMQISFMLNEVEKDVKSFIGNMDFPLLREHEADIEAITEQTIQDIIQHLTNLDGNAVYQLIETARRQEGYRIY